MQSAIKKSMLVTVLTTILSTPTVVAQTPDYARADVIRTAARYVFGTSLRPRESPLNSPVRGA